MKHVEGGVDSKKEDVLTGEVYMKWVCAIEVYKKMLTNRNKFINKLSKSKKKLFHLLDRQLFLEENDTSEG